MNIGQVSEILRKNLPQLYQFSFGLIPDDLQAKQVVIDAIELEASSLGEVTLIKYLSQFSPNKSEAGHNFLEKLLRGIFEIARKRSQHFQVNYSLLECEDKFKYFYQLDFASRGVLHLKYIEKFSLDDICDVSGLSKTQVIFILNTGRDKLYNQTYVQFESSRSMSGN